MKAKSCAEMTHDEILSGKWVPESELEGLKQKTRELMKKCPLVPNLTFLSIAERSEMLGEHSCQLDEWYKKMKELFK